MARKDSIADWVATPRVCRQFDGIAVGFIINAYRRLNISHGQRILRQGAGYLSSVLLGYIACAVESVDRLDHAGLIKRTLRGRFTPEFNNYIRVERMEFERADR